MVHLAVLLVLAGAVQLNVQSSFVSMSSTAVGSGIRAVPLMRGYEPPDELESQLTLQNSSVAAAISSSLFGVLAAAQEHRMLELSAQVPGATLVEVSSTRELDVVRNLGGDDPLDRGASKGVVGAAGAENHPSSTRTAGGLIEDEGAGENAANTYGVMEQSVQTSPTAELGLLSVRDTQYMGWIRVGTEKASDGQIGIPMRVVFDTGSTNLWITGEKCPKSLKDKYSAAKSPSKITGVAEYHVKIKFGTGQLEGVTVKDRVSVGPFSIPAGAVSQEQAVGFPSGQGFGLIEEEKGSIFAELDNFGGILGLGHRDMSMASPWGELDEDADGHVTPFFEHLVQTRQLATPEFSMYMNAQKNQYSAILFGGVDSRVVQKPAADKKMFQIARVRGRGGATGEEPHYWSVELYRIVYNKDCTDISATEEKQKAGESTGPYHPKCVDDPKMRTHCPNREDGKCPKVFQNSFVKSLNNPVAPSLVDKKGLDSSDKGRYFQDPALVFDSGTTLYTGPKAGVDEILMHIDKIQCSKIGTEIGTITYEVQGLKDPSDVCDEKCPSEDDSSAALGKHNCADTSLKSDDPHRFGDCSAGNNDNCRCLHKHKLSIDVVLQPHQFMVHDGGVNADVNAMSCRPGFWTIDVPEPNGPAWLLGELYMRHFVTVYRHEPPRKEGEDDSDCFRMQASKMGNAWDPKTPWKNGDQKSKFRPRHCDPPLVAWAPAKRNGKDDTDHASFIADLKGFGPGGPVYAAPDPAGKLSEKSQKQQLDHELDRKYTQDHARHLVDVKAGHPRLEQPRPHAELQLGAAAIVVS